MNEQQVEGLIAEATRSLKMIRQEYSARKDAVVEEEEAWKAQCDMTLKELDSMVNSLKPHLSSKLKNMISKAGGRYGASITKETLDFDKLVYYIDRLSELDLPDEVIQKNPNFCNSVLSVVAEEYVKIRIYLTNEKAVKHSEMEKKKNRVTEDYSERAKRTWNALCDPKLKQLAQKEAEETVRRIRNSL